MSGGLPSPEETGAGHGGRENMTREERLVAAQQADRYPSGWGNQWAYGPLATAAATDVAATLAQRPGWLSYC